MLRDKIENWFKSSYNVTQYNEAIAALKICGLLEILRRLGAPSMIKQGENVNVMAAQAARSAGYLEALDDLEFFEELYNPSRRVNITSIGEPDFGGNADAVKRGYLKENEVK